MFRLKGLKPRYLLGFSIFDVFDSEYDITEEYEKSLPKGSGFAGVKRIFYKQPDGNITPEMRSMYDAACTGFIFGGLVGGILSMARTPEKFAYENMATQFASHQDAARSIQRKVMEDFYKGFLSAGWRTSLFLTIFQSSATIFYAYEGEFKATHYMYAGGLTAMLFKIQAGPRAALSGTVFGSVFGLLGGVAIKGLLYLSGSTLEDIYRLKTEYLTQKDIKDRQVIPDRALPELKETYELLRSTKE